MIGKGYTSAEVAELLGLTPDRIRSFVAAGFLKPARSGRRYVFSFQDLVVLRAAKGLMDAKISPARVKRALKNLEASLPSGRSLTGVAIQADGSKIVVREESQSYDAEQGQILFDFEVKELSDAVRPILERAKDQLELQASSTTAEDWFELGSSLEMSSILKAQAAYRRAIDLDPKHADAHVNLGRLLHEAGRIDEAEGHYRRALEAAPDDPVAWFNLAVVLQARGQREQALSAYHHVLAVDPQAADAHYQMARLYEELGEEAAAVRHLTILRRLTHGT